MIGGISPLWEWWGFASSGIIAGNKIFKEKENL
jgi:hypothetical protein